MATKLETQMEFRMQGSYVRHTKVYAENVPFCQSANENKYKFFK